MKRQKGLTLLELMITIAIVAIVVTLGAPSILTAQRNLALSGAVENSYFALQQARSHAVRQSSDILVDFSDNAGWCIGTTDQGDCDCNVAASCTVDGVEQVLSSEDFPHIQMQNVNFGADDQAVFDGTRGLSIGSAGTLEFNDGNRTARLSLNDVGRVSICVVAGDLGNYEPCAL
ncbi:GspH/FimT family pseudopilin [Alteromonas sp. H39]|uniref:GspH/FimT family pseudopilin n=1 Tax=Alteromonas sp. H39 TaxID=3389876 RepID=UPI0039E0A854